MCFKVALSAQSLLKKLKVKEVEVEGDVISKWKHDVELDER
jgi:hypothetical protein